MLTSEYWRQTTRNSRLTVEYDDRRAHDLVVRVVADDHAVGRQEAAGVADHPRVDARRRTVALVPRDEECAVPAVRVGAVGELRELTEPRHRLQHERLAEDGAVGADEARRSTRPCAETTRYTLFRRVVTDGGAA